MKNKDFHKIFPHKEEFDGAVILYMKEITFTTLPYVNMGGQLYKEATVIQMVWDTN